MRKAQRVPFKLEHGTFCGSRLKILGLIHVVAFYQAGTKCTF